MLAKYALVPGWQLDGNNRFVDPAGETHDTAGFHPMKEEIDLVLNSASARTRLAHNRSGLRGGFGMVKSTLKSSYFE